MPAAFGFPSRARPELCRESFLGTEPGGGLVAYW